MTFNYYNPNAPAKDTRSDAFVLVPITKPDGTVVLVYKRALIAAGLVP